MRKIFLAAAICFVSCLAALADHRDQIDALVRPLIEAESLVGCVVGVLEDGRKDVYSYGRIRRDNDERPDGRTIYEIGSITKAFTGMLLADMVERRIVALDAPIKEVLPPEIKVPVVNEQPITLLHLATHTSGLPRLPTNMRPDVPNPYASYSRELMYAFLNGLQLQRAPGEYEYSNYGMGLLGQILSDQAGKSYESLIVERICDPLGMNDTRMTLNEEQRARLAPPYNGQGDAEHNWVFQSIAGAGALRSTCDDQLELLVAALSEDDTPVVRAIHKSWDQQHGTPTEGGMGLGWHISPGGVGRWHNGQTGGYSSFLAVHPPKRIGLVVLTNTATDLTTELGAKILRTTLGMKQEPIAVRKSIKVDADVLKKYAGTYLLAPLFWITVTVEDGRLMAQATGQEKFQLFAESETKFFYKVVDAQITLVENDDGEIGKLILHQNGKDLPGVKLPALGTSTSPR